MATLSTVKAFMERHHRASVRELAIGLGTTPDVARTLLEMWRTKKKVRRLVSACAVCGMAGTPGCVCAGGVDVSEVYEWVEAKQDKSDAL